ncbi:uncharacterized protein NPIL_248631 [Nephila pilipes]|uniref:Ubiquitin-like protease family profile domain-containing protein n=1 Tax=Nephila pilipes TaxID=299642 RepID=A0A8X6TTX3_NEPPI|nr:uncharacterized protein NPIL_248631 [Nephila pilipes]
MFASQISKILSKEAPRDFLGVYPADQIPKIKKRAAIVVNTDPHDKEGSHWLAMYIQEEKTIELFDSYGLPPSVYEPHISQYAKLFPNVISNEISLQSLSSNVCGQYCVLYLLKR